MQPVCGRPRPLWCAAWGKRSEMDIMWLTKINKYKKKPAMQQSFQENEVKIEYLQEVTSFHW